MTAAEILDLREWLTDLGERLSRIEGGIENQTRLCEGCQRAIGGHSAEMHDPRNGVQPRLGRLEGQASIVREVERRAWVGVKDVIVAAVGAGIYAIATWAFSRL